MGSKHIPDLYLYMGHWGHAYEIGELIQFLCSNGAGYITGVDILADGGTVFASTVEQLP